MQVAKWCCWCFHSAWMQFCSRSWHVEEGAAKKNLYCIVSNHISYVVAKQFDPGLITYGDLFFLKWAILGVFWRKIAHTVREICFSRRLRKMILLRRVNGVGGNNKNCWNLFYRCTGLKICFWYICTPGRKLGKTACCQIIVFLRLFSSVFRILLRFY